MGLEDFIPADAEIGSRQTFAGVIYYVDDFYVDVILYDAPDKKLSISKYVFTCPSEDIESAREVRLHYWKEKDGNTKVAAELIEIEADKEAQLRRVVALLKKWI
ncbi:MAG: hypothetical protein QW666_04030 [Candidatus Woesearchaeota archaeon]